MNGQRGIDRQMQGRAHKLFMLFLFLDDFYRDNGLSLHRLNDTISAHAYETRYSG